MLLLITPGPGGSGVAGGQDALVDEEHGDPAVEAVRATAPVGRVAAAAQARPAVVADHRDIHGPGSGWVVMGDPDMRLGDGRLEWVDGGLVRDIGAVSKDIDRKISAYLAARSGQAQQQESGH